ncbi:Pimeloyl-ACP methyl ester carboxylesterase [Oceanospirillum multiglobuliferum]|uniref:AB hydrolase-1 domain-containing protein n=1 Tax=Oceanospirillum multiglobuliferum TaxID=64969 RepID=A0A1T4KEA3_9GAMM|nr:alpha/beta hydrolase [Oceanospirillum multiglobuliferum]OPX56005.1 hypothetical protein BTE48_05425 [Oceanospirillum multiglobuliferum]SJZ40730.1 Pimeloyl-ACP methyl ester carboxylesterase [Oceanospirillum multiglobuliferum]
MNNTDLFCITSQERDPIVCLHSSLSSSQQWQKLALSFPDCITPDLLGYGNSPMPLQARHQFQLQHELEALKGQLFAQPFHLVGHSYGAATALQIAKRFPEQILSLTLFEPVAFHLLPDSSEALHAIKLLSEKISQDLETGNAKAAAECFIDYWSQQGSFARLSTELQQLFVEGIQKVAFDFSALLSEPTKLDDLRSIQCPVLLLEGLYSPHTTRAVIAVLAELFPEAERHSLECGHMGPLSHPQLVNPIVMQFIATHKKA